MSQDARCGPESGDGVFGLCGWYVGGVSGLDTFGVDLLVAEDEEERFRRLNGLSLLSMKPWTET